MLRNRKFFGFVGQDVAARASSSVANVCVAWLVFTSTHSAIDVGIVAIAESIATLAASLPAGTLVDRFSRRALLFISHTIQGLTFALLVVLLTLQGFHLNLLIAFVLAWSATAELYRSTSLSVLPELVDASDLVNANGIDRASTSIAAALSSAGAGGLIVLLGVSFGFVYSAAAYAFAAFLVAILVRPRPHRGTEPDSETRTGLRGMAHDMRVGFRWLLGEKGLWELSLSATAFNFLFGATWAFLVVYVGSVVKGGAVVFGGILAAYAVGDVIGSLLVGTTRALSFAGKVWVILYGGVSGVLLLALGLFPTPIVAITSGLLMGVAVGFSANVWLSSVQNIAPAGMRGRYFAIDGVLSFVAGPPAIAVGALLAEGVGVAAAFEIAGITMLIFALVFGLMKSLWTLDGRSRDAGSAERLCN
ncbi:hypothetical protein AUG86_04715 [Euryarchaeota archaeon 13_1_20CM_4_64_14]|nr:MAG: hypothetical protein AUG86_04715 [Euryarchaeota archaeon 13_1_20CM_4_64_14]